MDKKIYQILAILPLIFGAASVFLARESGQWFLPISLMVAAFLFLLARKNLKAAIFTIILLLPFLFNFNYLTFRPLSFLQWGGFSDFSINLSAALYLVVILFFAISLLTNLRTIAKTPLFIAIGLLVSFFCLSIFWSDHKQMSLIQLIYFITPFAIYFLTANILKTKEDFFQLLLVVIFSAFLPILLGFYQIISGDFFYETDSIFKRITGPFHHPNNFGLFLFLIISAIILFLHAVNADKTKNKIRTIMILFLIPAGVMLVFTFSRTAWIGIVIFAFLLSLQKTKQFFRTILLLGIIFSSLFFFEAPRERIAGVFQRSLYDSVYARKDILKIVAQKAMEKPIIGYGMGTFEEVVRSVKENYESSSFPHNDLSLFALEGGLVGLAFFAICLVQLLYYAAKRYFYCRKNTNEEVIVFSNKIFFNREIFAKGVIFLFLSLFIVSIAEATFRQTIMQIILWFLIGGWFAFTVPAKEIKKSA